jgi:universal stress protein A
MSARVQGCIVFVKGGRMQRVLVPTDFSCTSRAAVSYALALTAAMGGEILLLHVIEGAPLRRHIVRGEPEGLPYWLDPTGHLFQASCPQEVIYHDLYEEARGKLMTWLPPGLGKRSGALVTVGKVADEIVRVASEQKVDAIVMSIQGKRGVRRLLRRTVAERVMRKTSIPVITLWGIGAFPSPQHWLHELAWLHELDEEPPTATGAHSQRFASHGLGFESGTHGGIEYWKTL